MNIKLETLLKKLPNGNPVFDYQAIDKLGFPINIIISERGQKGKTLGIKEYMFNQHLTNSNKNIQCLFLRSLSKNAKTEAFNFLNDIPQNMQDELDNITQTKNAIYHNDKEVFVFKPVSTPDTTKGTRKIYNAIVWDEFNDSIKFFQKSLVDNFMNILSSADNPQERLKDGFNPRKLWMLGNNKGLNHPLLIELGITYIDNEITQIYDDNGNKLILIICPIYTPEDIRGMNEKFKNDWLFQLNKKAGTVDGIYYNMADFDSINWTKRYFEDNTEEKLPFNERLIVVGTWDIDGHLLTIFKVPQCRRDPKLKNRVHVLDITLQNNYLRRKSEEEILERFVFPVIYGNKVKEGRILIPTEFKNEVKRWIANSWVSFENTVSRDYFLKGLK